MSLVKCPRCELNYTNENDIYCEICKKELKGEVDSDDTQDICPECNEHFVIQGEDLCISCLKDKIRQEGSDHEDSIMDDEEVEFIDEDVIELQEIPIKEININETNDIPETEVIEMNREFNALHNDIDLVDDDKEDHQSVNTTDSKMMDKSDARINHIKKNIDNRGYL